MKQKEHLPFSEFLEKHYRLESTYKPDLRASFYQKRDSDGNIKFRLYISDEVGNSITPDNYRTVLQATHQDLRTLRKNPYGENSIDPHKDIEFIRENRRINKGSDELEHLLGFPIAIKEGGTHIGKKRDRFGNLILQYERMRWLQIHPEKILSPEQQELIDFCPVYAAIEYPHENTGVRQWIVMKRVPQARTVREMWDEMFMTPVVKAEEHPELFRVFIGDLIRNFDVTEYIPYQGFQTIAGTEIDRMSLDDIMLMLWKTKGVKLSDFRGRNILWTEEEKKHYTIVDQ